MKAEYLILNEFFKQFKIGKELNNFLKSIQKRATRKRSIAKEFTRYGINRACRVLRLSKSVYYHKHLVKDDGHIEQALQKSPKTSRRRISKSIYI